MSQQGRAFLGAGFAVACILAPRVATAEAPARVTYEAPEGCPDVGAFEHYLNEIETVPRESADYTRGVDVTITHGERFDGTMTIHSTETGEIARSVSGAHCDDVARALALAAALALERIPPKPVAPSTMRWPAVSDSSKPRYVAHDVGTGIAADAVIGLGGDDAARALYGFRGKISLFDTPYGHFGLGGGAAEINVDDYGAHGDVQFAGVAWMWGAPWTDTVMGAELEGGPMRESLRHQSSCSGYCFDQSSFKNFQTGVATSSPRMDSPYASTILTGYTSFALVEQIPIHRFPIRPVFREGGLMIFDQAGSAIFLFTASAGLALRGW